MSLLVLTSLACVNRTYTPACEVVSETAISDEEQTDLGSPQDLLDQLVLEQYALGTWADGEQTQAYVRLQRASGSAVLIEERYTERVTEQRSVGRAYDFYPGIDVMCSDRLELPIALELRTLDGLLDLAMEGVSSVSASSVDPEGASASASRGMGADELPVFDQDPVDYSERTLQVSLSAVQGALVKGSVGWSGLAVDQESVQVSERVLVLRAE